MSEKREIILLRNYTHQSSKIHTYLRRTLRSDTILVNKTPFKMTESAFYFILKVLFILNILILNMYKSGLIVKIGLISNFLTSQPG